MKAIFVKSGDGLRPASTEAMRVLAQYQAGDEVMIEHKRGRSAGNHRRFFSFVQMTFDWQEQYGDVEIWRKVLEMAAGHFETVIDSKGKTYLWPKSIAWDELDEDAFRDLFGRVVNVYLARYGERLSDLQVNMAASF